MAKANRVWVVSIYHSSGYGGKNAYRRKADAQAHVVSLAETCLGDSRAYTRHEAQRLANKVLETGSDRALQELVDLVGSAGAGELSIEELELA